MTKRDLKLKHLKAMIAIARALNAIDLGSGDLTLSGPKPNKKSERLAKWSIEKIHNLTKENDKFAADLEEKNAKLAFLEEQVRVLGVNPEFLYKNGGLDSHGQPKPNNKEVAIKFDMPCQINEDFKSDDSHLDEAIHPSKNTIQFVNKAKAPFTKRNQKTEVEPELFRNEAMQEITLEDFKKTGLLLLVNQMLHAFGMAIVIKYRDDNSPQSMFPARVSYRGFAGKGVEEAYENIGLYLTKNSAQLYNETGDDHDFQPEKTQF